MKHFVLISILLFFLASCKKEAETPTVIPSQKIEIKDVSNSECKNVTQKSVLWEQESIRLQMLSPKELKITHYNTIFNCCPGELKVEKLVVGDTLKLNEYITEGFCNCICPYDITCTLYGVNYQNYVFKILKENVGHYQFNMTLSADLDTTVVINPFI